MFLGLSNTTGPGSGWRLDEHGTLQLRFSLDKAIPDTTTRSSLLRPGAAASCDNLSEDQWSLAPEIALAGILESVEQKLDIKISSGKKVQLNVKSWRLDQLEEVNYEQWLHSETSGAYGNDLVSPASKQPRFVMKSGVLINGLYGKLTLDQKDRASLDAKLPIGASSDLTIGVGITAKRDSSDTLTIRAKGQFYIAGIFVPVREYGLGALPSTDALLPDVHVFSATQAIDPNPSMPRD